MTHPANPRSQEEGSVLLVALIVLLLVTFLGFASLNLTETEVKIAGNDRSYRQNFYRAESLIKEAALTLDVATNPSPSNPSIPWLSDGTISSAFDPEADDWITTGTTANAQSSSFYADHADYCAIRLQTAPGSNEDMGGEQKWQYVIYGRSTLASGRVEIAAGYLKKSN